MENKNIVTIKDKLAKIYEIKKELQEILKCKGLTPNNNFKENVNLVKSLDLTKNEYSCVIYRHGHPWKRLRLIRKNT